MNRAAILQTYRVRISRELWQECIMLGLCTDRVGMGIAWEVSGHFWVAHMQHGKLHVKDSFENTG